MFCLFGGKRNILLALSQKIMPLMSYGAPVGCWKCFTLFFNHYSKHRGLCELPGSLKQLWSVLASPFDHSLFSRFLTYCPSKRIIADEALKHEYFRESPLPIDPSMFPTWPAKSEQQRVKRGTSPRPPEGGLGYSLLVRTLSSTFSITYSYQSLWMLSVLNRLQTYRLCISSSCFPW